MNQHVVNQHHLHPGIAGGLSGAPDRCVLKGTVEVAPSVANLLLETGEQLVYEFGGGGGWGDLLDRDPQAVLDDVWDEYVSIEGALRDYGVVIADGWTAHATVDARTLRPTRVPSWLAEAIVSAETAGPAAAG